MSDMNNALGGKPGGKAGGGRELISFRIGAQEFCVDIMSVREIRGWTPATALPHAPDYMHVIIVAQIGRQQVGLLVDAVSDIITVGDADVQPTPDIASELVKTFVRGILAIDGRMISLIALHHVLPDLEMEAA